MSSSRARFTGRVAILLLVAAVLAVSYASSARAWLQQRSDISSLRSQIVQSKAAIATLTSDAGTIPHTSRPRPGCASAG
jgi:cell division protein FtsL